MIDASKQLTYQNHSSFARRLIASLGLVFVGTMTMGGMCDPPPPQDNNCEPIECDSGQVVICQNQCVTPVPIGGQCNLTNTCAPDSTCTDGATCVSTAGSPAGKGVCRCIGREWLAQCSVPDWSYPRAPSRECASGLFCKSGSCPGWNVNRCVKPRKFGDTCDNSFVGADLTPCNECEPGLRCVGSGSSDSANGLCLKNCEADSECPCGAKCDDSGGTSSLCKPCRSLHQQCDALHACCDQGSKCGPDGHCCMNRHEVCSGTGDCCGSDRCVQLSGDDKRCVACRPYGEQCNDDNDCCGGGDCREGVCSPVCHEGTDCTVPHQKGECAKGKWKCFPGGRECEQLVQPSPEQCNSKDDDCDGYTDEEADGVGDQCDNPRNVHCQGGFDVKGHQVCKNGKLRCLAKEGPNGDYCGHCGGACGACEGQPCSQGNLCSPNMTCDGLPGHIVCKRGIDWCSPPDSPQCWHEKDVGKCLGTLIGGSGGAAQ